MELLLAHRLGWLLPALMLLLLAVQVLIKTETETKTRKSQKLTQAPTSSLIPQHSTLPMWPVMVIWGSRVTVSHRTILPSLQKRKKKRTQRSG